MSTDTLDSLVAEITALLPKVGKGPSEIDARFAEVALELVPMLLEERKRLTQDLSDITTGFNIQKSLRKAAEAKLAEQRWVSVEERLPEPQKDGELPRKWYEVTNGERVDHAMLLHGKTFMGHHLQFDDVKWWREIGPLPAPPDGGKE